MRAKFYVAMAANVDCYEQSDYLFIIKVEGRGIIGYAGEFDVCTLDIKDACTVEKANNVKWFPWDDGWEWRAATLEEIKALCLEKYLVGSKKDMKVSTPIDAI